MKHNILNAMKAKLIRGPIEVRKSTIQGYGLFATSLIKKDAIIEECYTLIVQRDVYNEAYVFNWPDTTEKTAALALGSGSIFNHSDTPNAHWTIDPYNQLIIFSAIKDIKAGEEITVSYGNKWFESRNMRAILAKTRYALYKHRFATFLSKLFLVVAVFVALLTLYTHNNVPIPNQASVEIR